MVCANQLPHAKIENCKEFRDFAMPMTLDAAQLSGITAIVACATRFAEVRLQS
jgi:hypothetical protein